jgi:maltokinase
VTAHDQARPLDDVKAFIEGARWFGGKGRDFEVTAVQRVGWVETGTSARASIELVTLTYADGSPGETELYQLPLSYYAERQERLSHAFVGWWEEPELGGYVHAYDAVHDREAMAGWLRAFDQGAAGVVTTGSTTEPTLAWHRLPGHDLDTDAHSTLFSGEQSNSSLAFGDDALLKVFRKVTPGVNPDIAVHQVLTEAGSDHVAHLYGWLEVPGFETGADAPSSTNAGTGPPLQLAMLQQFLRTATDGWDAALTSVRNLFAEADLRADEVGGDFAAEASRLGESLAEVHRTLAAHFPTHVRSADEQAALAEAMGARLDAALDVVPDLAPYAKALHATFAAVADVPGVQVQQVHGDLHLGQTLRTVKGWKIVDFEGEPAKPLAERVLPDSAWRDVAGMLRSFDYAPRVAERTAAGADDTGAEQRAFRAAEWAERNCAAFLAAYVGDRALTDDEQVLLDAYIADKAVYEAVYEARNRPSWVPVPLTAIQRLAGEVERSSP